MHSIEGLQKLHTSGYSLTHLIYSIAQLFATPSQPPHSRSLNCPKQSHTSSTHPVTLPVHDRFCVQTIADLFGAPDYPPYARSLHAKTITHLFDTPSRPANAQSLLCPINRRPLRCAQSYAFTLTLLSQSPYQSTITSVPKTIPHLFSVPSHPPCAIPLSHTLFAMSFLRCYLCNLLIPQETIHSLSTPSVHSIDGLQKLHSSGIFTHPSHLSPFIPDYASLHESILST